MEIADNNYPYGTLLPAIHHPKSRKPPSKQHPSKTIVAPVSIPMPIKWKEHQVKGWRPETREGATFTTVVTSRMGGGEEERIFLFGGLSRDLHGIIACLRFDPMKNSYVWSVLSEGDLNKKRYGHTTTLYDKNLVIVGGARMYNKDAKRRECRNDVVLFHTVTQEWTEIKPEGLMFEPRRYHTAVLVGKHVIVYGGVNAQNSYMGDLMALNMGTLVEKHGEYKYVYRWTMLNAKGEKPGPLANHACQLVLHPERYRTPGLISLTSLPEIRLSRSRFELEGMYLFGGRDEKGAKNKLYVLKIGHKVLEWVEAKIEGPAPLPRYGHSMNYYPQKGIMVLFGGRNDENFAVSGQSYLNDVWVLTLEKLLWTKWDNKEGMKSAPVPRYSHCSAVMNGAVIIFGGLSEDNYCRSTIYSLEMESSAYKLGLGYPLTNKKELHEEKPKSNTDASEEEKQPVGNPLEQTDTKGTILPDIGELGESPEEIDVSKISTVKPPPQEKSVEVANEGAVLSQFGKLNLNEGESKEIEEDMEAT